ncbi:vacuolar protein sorting-associated protein 36-like [Pyrus ussuriensis x Pyrus communis]|uniref:Vacuolar protein-sorting-associated protein 36 n=1 Tax=Pyrus ussuriensis x Pyrus communis TaxID=2448454 RepID=A0A5N5I1S1_9ROSA|nr:vacuolar protein sorting-associated protein 36-like [Pyrus ussuriensis x Pyrus communis]
MAGNCLQAAELTTSGRPVLLPTEIECSLLSAVDLECEDLPNFPHLKSGLLILTTHRLLWLPDSTTTIATASSSASAIPLAAITHIFAAKKSIKSMFASPRFRFQLSVSPEGRVPDSGSGSRSVVVTVVVRGKGDLDAFLSKFWESWRGRAWEIGDEPGSSDAVSGSGSASSSGLYTREGTVRMVGVSGILRKEQEMWESTDKSLQDAFQDLNALMVFARIKTLVTKPDALRTGISASDAAITLGIAPGMAKEHLLTAESKGLLCRDISPDGFRFYINLFPEFDSDDLYLVKDYGIYHTWLRAVSASG